MRLEVKEHGSKEYYNEFLYVAAKYNKIKKNPRRKVYNFTKYLIVYNVLVFLMVILSLHFYFSTYSTVYMFYVGAFSGALAIQIGYLYKCRKRINLLLNTKGVRIIEFSASGIEYIDDDKNIRVKWDDIKYVVINKYTICIIPKIVINGFTSIDTKYKEEIIATLKKYNKLSLLIDNSDYYNR